MIVGEENCGGPVPRGIDDDGPKREFDATRVSLVTREMKTAGLVVEVRDPEILFHRIGFSEAGREEAAGAGKAVEDDGDFGTLIPHAWGATASSPAERPKPYPIWCPFRR